METEEQVQIRLAQYLSAQYSNVVFHNDFGSGTKLSISQAKRQKLMNGKWRGYPDLFICKPHNGYHGLFLELKRSGTRLLKRNGEPASVHIAEQSAMLELLRKEGYKAEFACGFDEAVEIVDKYLGGVEKCGR